MLKLNLGAADRKIDGFTSVDIVPPADIVADLAGPWPWPDSSVDEIIAFDIVEHLPDKCHTMNEMWRVLRNGGRATIEVPTIQGVGSVCDPTHLSYWSAGTFEYFEKDNFARERFRGSAYYGINADFKILSMEKSSYLNRFEEEVRKVKAVLEALK